MDTHKNAPLTPKGREAMVRSVIEGGLTKAAVALQFNVSAKTVAKWVKRFRAEGVNGLRDRSSRPIHCRTKPRQPHARSSRPCAGSAIQANRSPPRLASRRRPSVVSCGGLGLNRLRNLEPAEPVRRYEREHPGELIHIDIKKLGKFNRVGHRITGDRTGQSSLRARGEGPGWETEVARSLLRATMKSMPARTKLRAAGRAGSG
ncbi:transposase IS481 family protein [Bradyrhizobium huanghuaihaiense]|uniref:Transposase IS481 family protein n=1 Tax=Bradyrhizobium huanghuaihaiense TaxID=990078 RepID=A0A562QU44_9BRAD|nr:transposase IS481 family protein [Bradyrhizobium huanghuaihaiense]